MDSIFFNNTHYISLLNKPWFFKFLNTEISIQLVSLISSDEEEVGFEKLEVVKKYFKRIFAILSKEVKEELNKLNLSKEEIKEIKKEISFLPEEKQIEFLKELAKNND